MTSSLSNWTRVVAYIAFCALVFGVTCRSAQGAEISVQTDIQELREEFIAPWDRSAWFQKGLIGLTIVLGATVASLQGLPQRNARIASGIIAIVISISVGLKSAFIDVDFRAYGRAIERANDRLSDFEDQWEEEDLGKPDLRQNYQRDRRTLKKQIRAIRDGLSSTPKRTTSQSSTSLGFLVSVAHAQSPEIQKVPGWYADPPIIKGKAVVTARATDRELEKARMAAEGSALASFSKVIGATLQAKFPNRLDEKGNEIASLVAEVIEENLRPDWKEGILQRHFYYDEKAGRYVAFVMVAIDSELVKDIYDDFAEGYISEEIKNGMWQQIKIILGRPIREAAYNLRRQEIYQRIEQREGKRFADTYKRFEEGRKKRQEKNYKEAIEILRAVVDNHPNFYLASFNLALAYNKLGKAGETEQFYKKAIAIEKNFPQSLRDASVYNSYGWFLYQNGRYEEALQLYNKALEIDPQHPKALRSRHNLALELQKGKSSKK